MVPLFRMQRVLCYLGLGRHGWTTGLACWGAVGLWVPSGMLCGFVWGQLRPSFQLKGADLWEGKKKSDMQRILFSLQYPKVFRTLETARTGWWTAVLEQKNAAQYLSTSRGSNWAGIACILCWPGPISCGFTAISWFRISISCRCRSSAKHTQFCCQWRKLGTDSGCSTALPEKKSYVLFPLVKITPFFLIATE